MAKTNPVIIPDEGEDDGEPNVATAVAPGTSDAEAVANGLKLGPSATNVPIGMPKTLRIVLDETDNMAPTGQMVSLNGRAFLIRPGEEVDLPLGVIEVLDNAVMAVPIVDPQTLKVVGHRPRLRFPYRVVKRAA